MKKNNTNTKQILNDFFSIIILEQFKTLRFKKMKSSGFSKLIIKLNKSKLKLNKLKEITLMPEELKQIASLQDTAEFYLDYCNEIINNDNLKMSDSLKDKACIINDFCKTIEKIE